MLRTFQSSPAPKGGSQIVTPASPVYGFSFQSSPAPKGGSQMASDGVALAALPVSILSRPEGREPVADALHSAATQLAFQSSPAPKGGSQESEMTATFVFDEFQSSPAPKGGSQRVPTDSRWHRRSVSILSRPEGREPGWILRVISSDLVAVSILSRPEGREPGVKMNWQSHALIAVSILSHPEGREPGRRTRHTRSKTRVSILSRPEGREPGPADALRREGYNAVDVFQSSPAPKGGSQGAGRQ